RSNSRPGRSVEACVLADEDGALDASLVAVSVWYHVGAINERPGRSGFAHLFEHMMFQASPHVGEDQHFKVLQQVGATGTNGTTDFDRTNYFETVPSNALETALWLESDRMGFLLTTLTQKSLTNQIDVVKNERRQSVENRAYGLMSEKITQTLYPQPHPYYGDVIGSMADIGAANIADVQDFFRTYYTPANATLTLAGDFDIADTKALIQKYFGTLKGKPAPPRAEIAAPKLTKEVRIEFPEPVGQLQKLVMVWMGPSAYQTDAATLDVLAHVISGTRSSRLDRKVSFEDRIAQSVTAYFAEYASGGRFVVDVTAAPGRTAAEAEAAVKGVLADLRTNPPTQAEVERAINTTETALVRGLEQVGGMGGRAEQLQRYNHYLGDPGRLGWDIGRYRKVTPAAVSAALEQYLGDARLVVHAIPVGAQP
ncbi:MAG: pitrilysin family protein, partial [Myxococcota bacterium]